MAALGPLGVAGGRGGPSPWKAKMVAAPIIHEGEEEEGEGATAKDKEMYKEVYVRSSGGAAAVPGDESGISHVRYCIF